MKISADAKDTILFCFGCLGMFVHGLILPSLPGRDFELELFGAWMGVAGIGVFGGLDIRRRKDRDPEEKS